TMAEGDIKEPPPKPSRIRTTTASSSSSIGPTTPVGSNGRHSGNASPVTRTSLPHSRVTTKLAPATVPKVDEVPNHTEAERNGRPTCVSLVTDKDKDKDNDKHPTTDIDSNGHSVVLQKQTQPRPQPYPQELDPSSWKTLLRDPASRPKPGTNAIAAIAPTPTLPMNAGPTPSTAPLIRPAPQAPPRPSPGPGPGPTPPPKPKRMSHPPLPKAKPANLQALPLQPRSDPPPLPASSSTSSSSPARSFIPSSASASTVTPALPKVPPVSTSTPLSSPLSLPQVPLKPAHTLATLSRSTELPQSTPTAPSPFISSGTTITTSSSSVQQQPTPPSSHSPVRPSFLIHSNGVGPATRSQSAQPSQENNNNGRVESVFTNSSPPPTSSSTPLFQTRSRLRSASDTKTSPFVATAVPQSSRVYKSPGAGGTAAGVKGTGQPSGVNGKGGGGGGGGGRGWSSPNGGGGHNGSSTTLQYASSDSEDYSDENQTSTRLTASLQKIQALAQEQTERMKQVNYLEKRADLTEAVIEKSSLWRARGAEWSGLAKKAWDDRGGMGGITGGLADRWRRK
ncbi:hypothetical protein BGZ94_005525, partial [Podila epigama]